MLCLCKWIDQHLAVAHFQCTPSSGNPLNVLLHYKFKQLRATRSVLTIDTHGRYSTLYLVECWFPHCDSLGTNATRCSAAYYGAVAPVHNRQACDCRRNVFVMVGCYALLDWWWNTRGKGSDNLCFCKGCKKLLT